MTRVLITGASGRFAPFVIDALRDDYELVLTSRTPPAERYADLPWIKADITQFDDCRRMVEGIDVIQHQGANPYPSDHPRIREQMAESGRDLPDLGYTMQANIMGPYYLLMSAVEAGVKTVVMTGSNCAFGQGYRISDRPFQVKYLPMDEDHPSDVEDSYSYSKLAGEELLAQFTRAYGIRTYMTRPSGICPEDRLRNMAANAKPCEGWSEWMFAYVPSVDLASMQKLIMEQADSLPAHDVFVANALDSSLLEPTMEVIERFRPELAPLCRGISGHDALFSPKKAQRVLGWEQSMSWREFL